MKPLKLEFSGINSFSENTIIDFESLTKGGIFGIFGDTGSGKSTILDCINFALYGNVERSKEKIDIINYRSDSAKVNFSFNILNGGKRKIYTVERVLKKDKYGTHKAMLYESDGESEICIADKASQVEKKIIEILGVEAEDFRKCIALPQGEFAQFVKSLPSERLKLMERLFNLSRYGDRLKFKISELEKEIEGKFQNLNGRLVSYEGVTKQALKEAESELAKETAELSKLKKKESEITAKYEKLKELNVKRRELFDIQTQLEEMEGQKSKIEELRAGLSTLASCREAVKCDGEIQNKRQNISELTADGIKLKKELDAAICRIYALEKHYADGNFDEKIAQCVALDARYAACAGKAEKLESINRSLAEKRAEYKSIGEELQSLTVAAQKLEIELKRLDVELDALAVKDIDKLINVEFKGAVLRDEYVKNLDWLATVNGNVKIYKDDSPLCEYVSCEIENKISEYTQRVMDVRDFGRDKISESITAFQAAEKLREEKQKEVNVTREKLHTLNANIKIRQSALDSSEKEGRDMRVRADELVAELEGAFGKACKSYGDTVEENSATLRRLKSEKDGLAAEIETEKSKKQELTVSLEKLNTLKCTSETELKSLEEKLDNIIKSNALVSVGKCRESAEKFANFPDAEKSVSDYDAKLFSLNARGEELKKIDGILAATDDVLSDSEREKSSIYGGVAQLTGSLAVKENYVNDLKKRLEERAEIEKEFAVWEAKRTLTARLKEATKNNKFLEFIANEYLADISSLASSTLLKLTGGRYFLTYKDNNFSVGDNFNCGDLRGVNTLSGGETFLVSLSLALALSQTICSKSQKSIEFFFLDEGFGTLDTSLVDTVMNALEKLKSSAFTIGVISHVEELKHRISNKITVIKATENHGSTVNVSF